jgi:hypothetical protein
MTNDSTLDHVGPDVSSGQRAKRANHRRSAAMLRTGQADESVRPYAFGFHPIN